MKRSVRLCSFALAMLAALTACGPASEPAVAPSIVPLLSLQPPPVYSLLGYRDRLQLSSPQVLALDSIAQAVNAATRPVREQLADEEQRRTAEATQQMVQSVRTQNRAAAEGVHTLLSAAQRAEVCSLYEEAANERNENTRRAPTRGDQRTRRARMAADSLLALSHAPTWYWCAKPKSPAKS